MKQIPCPINGLRPAQEFVFGGEVREMPDPAACSDAEWADYVFNRSGEPGKRKEWWYHVPSGTWFIAERDTLRDIFVTSYLYRPPAVVNPPDLNGSVAQGSDGKP